VHRTSSAPTTPKEKKRELYRFIQNLVNIHPELLDAFIRPGGVSAMGSKSLGAGPSVIPTGRYIAIVSGARVSAAPAGLVQLPTYQINEDEAYKYLKMYLNGLTPADIYRELNEQIYLADHEGNAERSASLKELLAIYGEERDWSAAMYARARRSRYAMMDFFADVRERTRDSPPKYLALLKASLDALVKKVKRGGRRRRKHRTMRMRRRKHKTQRRLRRVRR
jgi:hypothetical protein